MQGEPRKSSLYEGAVLAPMVRCGTLPLRIQAIAYGANAVWGEELIAQKLATCIRVENAALGTVDFNTPCGSQVFRTCPALEKGKLICQLGAATAACALAASRVVEADVDGIDINMGCPIKFSIQGGMGAALLEKIEVAEDIVRTLATNLSIPVSAKIRLLATQEETIAFAKRLADAGAACITVHMRSKDERDRSPARWGTLAPIVKALHPTPVLANGDMYRWPDIDALMTGSGCTGVMLARPALLNLSMFRRDKPLIPLERVIFSYLEENVRWDGVYQNTKYTVSSTV